MVPESRVQDGSFPIPKLLIGKEDISQFIDEFRGFHAQFADCFSREEPRVLPPVSLGTLFTDENSPLAQMN